MKLWLIRLNFIGALQAACLVKQGAVMVYFEHLGTRVFSVNEVTALENLV